MIVLRFLVLYLLVPTIIAYVITSTAVLYKPKFVSNHPEYFTVRDKYGYYCGANHTSSLFPPCDAIDKCCMDHDICTTNDGMTSEKCHIKLLYCMNAVFPIKDRCCHVRIAQKIEYTTKWAKYCYENYLEKDEKILTKIIGAGAAIVLGSVCPPMGLIVGFLTFLGIMGDTENFDKCKAFITTVFS
jgi:hypothetical protein